MKWHINAITGSLIKDSVLDEVDEASLNPKILNALESCKNPFLLSSSLAHQQNCPDHSLKQKLRQPKFILDMLSKKWLFLSLAYASNQNILFDDSISAFNCVNSIYPNGVGENCLQKSLLVAKTSKSFKESGVIFLGANLPTGHMHSWIIENNIQPDITDRHWISYQPLMAIHFI